MLTTKEKFDSGLSKLPAWFRQEVPEMGKIRMMKDLFRSGRLHTVCESANCPNMGACWKEGVATFMILGGTCTRACRFCNVPAGRPELIDAEEPANVAAAVKQLGLRYVVITSVARDDVEDEGAGQFAATIAAIRRLTPQVKIEVLVPDFSAREACLKTVSEAAPEVISHNIETVRRLSPLVRPQAEYERSLEVLKAFARLRPQAFVKSSLMVGLGETSAEVVETMADLLEADCRILTIGQYLAPARSKRHLRVERFIEPAEFESMRQQGLKMGFVHVESGPLVRSSYIAEKGYRQALAALAMEGTKTDVR